MQELTDDQKSSIESALSRKISSDEEGAIASFLLLNNNDNDEFRKISSQNTVHAILFIKFKLRECTLQQASSYYDFVVRQRKSVEKWMSSEE